MQKFSKSLLTVLGIIALLAFVGVMMYDVIQINQLHAVSNANRSSEFPNPRNWVLIGAALGLLAGFLLGFALAMPNRSFKARYQAQRDADEQKAEALRVKEQEAEERADSHVADSSPVEIEDTPAVDPTDPPRLS